MSMAVETKNLSSWMRYSSLTAAVAEKFGEAEREGEGAGGEAAHRDHQGKPAGVGVWALAAGDTSKRGEDKDSRDRAGEEDAEAGAQELAGIGLHHSSSPVTCNREILRSAVFPEEKRR